ncbi:MAG: CoA-binding protein [Coleofasciculaceae cyanobacterium]
MNLTSDSKVLIQGITQTLGSYHAARMKAYGTNVVAGVSPGLGGSEVHGIPVFDLVEQAWQQVGSIDVTIIFVESYQALDAALEAIDAGIRQVILVTGEIPPLDIVRLLRKAKITDTLIIGPSSSGIVIPDQALLGTQETEFYTPGPVAIISRAGNLTYEVALSLTKAKLGQSIVVNLGCEPIVSSSFEQWLPLLAQHKSTEAIVLVDQTGGSGAEATAELVADVIDKPVVTYVVGSYTPVDKQLNDAGAVIAAQLSGPITKINTAQHKVEAYRQAKVLVAEIPSQIPGLVKKVLKK